jgi:iron only hydrogenase large subunit-like protein
MDQQERRLKIFREIAKLAYKNELREKIDDIPQMFEGNQNDKRKIAAIKNDVLVAMGLNPTARFDTELSYEVDAALNLETIEQPLVTVNRNICEECKDDEDKKMCLNSCIFGKDDHLTGEKPIIESGKCISCGKCIPNCPLGAISDKIEFIPMTKYLNKNIPVYATVAPAIAGQFGRNVSMGMLRSALKTIGFTDMIEVAMFADMVTLKEADEFNNLIKTEDDFLITSCCCPVWVNLLTKHYGKLAQRLTRTVSPMIASGRIVKTIFPNSITVFIGPCIAKKAEAKQPELKGAIDYVLTFSELDQIFKALEIDPSKMENDHKEQSSYGGRVYARTGGVSEAVKITVDRIDPHRTVKFDAVQAEGVEECRKLLEELKNNRVKANFIEGMGCKGGCVGGPRRNIDVAEGEKLVNEYGSLSPTNNPIDNDAVKRLMKYLKDLEEGSFEQLLLRDYKQ